MKKFLTFLAAVMVCGATALAQMGGPTGGGLDTSLDQLFDKTPVFTATLQTVMSGPNGSMSASTKMYYDHGSSRSEMDMSNVHGSTLPPNALTQAKALGMDRVITIAPSSRTKVYTIYPNLNGYISTPVPAGSTDQKNNIQITKLGTETVQGHPCIKNQLTIAGQPPLTVWNATDLNNFPIQITISDQGSSATMNFVNISFGGIAAAEFNPPSTYKQYASIQELMQAAIISHVGGGTPAAPATPSQ
jgi:Domain of unknown function (DUF4412)